MLGKRSQAHLFTAFFRRGVDAGQNLIQRCASGTSRTSCTRKPGTSPTFDTDQCRHLCCSISRLGRRLLRTGSMTLKRSVSLVILVVIAAAAAFGAWTLYLRPVRVAVAGTARDVAVQVFGLGTVEARVTSKVGFKVSGVLVDLGADVGDHVARGMVLARLDDREQRARTARAAAAVQQAEANFQRANASVHKAQANYDNAKRISERRQALVESKTTSVETAETAQAVKDAAFGDLNLAKSDVMVAQAAIGDAKAQLQQETATLDFHTLAAPYDAMVTARLKELGSALAAGEPVFTLIDPKTIWVLAFIDESKAGEIKVGEPAEIVARSHPGARLQGRVARIEPESDRDRPVALLAGEAEGEVALGLVADVLIDVGNYVTLCHV